MQAFNNYKTIVFSITSILLFSVWKFVIVNFDGNAVLIGLIELLLTIGTYKMVSKFIELILLKIPFAKKLVFNSSYMEGQWVGCYIGTNNEPIYFIEAYEQTFDSLIIRGKAYFSDGSYKGNWVSENVNIDVINGAITYTYTTDFINNSHKNQGLAVFYFERKNATAAPYMLRGFSTDIFSQKKTKSIEMKINKKYMTDIDLISEAKKLYCDNKDYF